MLFSQYIYFKNFGATDILDRVHTDATYNAYTIQRDRGATKPVIDDVRVCVRAYLRFIFELFIEFSILSISFGVSSLPKTGLFSD